jgi:hypothetical protein
MEEGKGPVKKLDSTERKLNAVRDPIDEGRGPVKELE